MIGPSAGADAARAVEDADACRRAAADRETPRWPKIVSSSRTPPARPHPAFTNISAATCAMLPDVADPFDEIGDARERGEPAQRRTAGRRRVVPRARR